MNFGVNENLNKMNTQSELNNKVAVPPKSKPQNVIKKTTQYVTAKLSKSEPQRKSLAVNVKKHNSKADSDLTIILVLSSLSRYITAQLLSKYVL